MPVSLIRKGLYRTCQTILYLASFFMPWPRPKLLKGSNAVFQLPSLLKSKNLSRPLLVCDEGVMKIGLPQSLIERLTAEGLEVTTFSKVTPNPTVDLIESAVVVYRENKCDHIIAFGGGSAIDCAKVVGARIARPKKPISKMKGLFGVLWKLPLVVAVPTTAGTGSECTLAAVVSNPKTKEKYALEDPFLFPPYAVLDPLLTVGLPPFVTATTGMDTLTHGVEAYLNLFHTPQTKKDAVCAIQLTFQHLKAAYDDGNNIEAREMMQEAAYLGGLAFTRAYVGNVHAVAHALGGFYHVPHGLANAVALPIVLEKYGKAIYSDLAYLADKVGLKGASTEEKAKAFMEAIKSLNASMNIPSTLGASYDVATEDIPLMAQQALDEANPLYPVPVIFDKKDMEAIFTLVTR
eukprot:gene5959-4268_t